MVWILVAVTFAVFGLFFFVATTVLSPETQLGKNIEKFLVESSYTEVEKSKEIVTMNGRPTVDTFYDAEITVVMHFFEQQHSFASAFHGLENVQTGRVGRIQYRAPKRFKTFAEIEWFDPQFNNTTWPQTFTYRVWRYVNND